MRRVPSPVSYYTSLFAYCIYTNKISDNVNKYINVVGYYVTFGTRCDVRDSVYDSIRFLVIGASDYRVKK